MKIVLPTLHVRRSVQAIPLAAGCITAALPDSLRKTTQLLDFYPEDRDEDILSLILAESPDLIGFSVYVWNRTRVVELATKLRQINSKLLLVAGGPEATGDPIGLSNVFHWNALVHGEGELSFAALVKAYAERKSTESIPGVTFEPRPGSTFSTAQYLADLNTAPSPWLTGQLVPSVEGGVLWEVARGCAFSCDYCFEARRPEGVRTLNRSRLIAELELFRELNVTQVWVLDSTFNYPPERGIQLLELLIAHAPEFHYHLEAKTDYIGRHMVNLLGHLSCSVQLGVQSTQEKVLKSIHRPLDLSRLTESIHLLETNNIIYGFDLIYGLPMDDYAGFCNSLDTVLSFAPNHVHIFPLEILPGTRLAKQIKRFGMIVNNDPPYNLIASDSWTQEDLDRAKLLATSVDIFYNTGRAVAFFPTLMHTLNTSPSTFFEDFLSWVFKQSDIDKELIVESEQWTATEIYRLHQRYIEYRLRHAGKDHLVSAVFDLLCYHFHYAETLLGDELPPAPKDLLEQVDFWEIPWQRAQQIRMVPFVYEVFDLLEMEDLDLNEFVSLFRPVGSVAVFLRRNNEVICESLGEDFLRLLKGSNGDHSPKEIFAGSVPQETGREMVAFAVSEGLLQIPESFSGN